VVTPVRTYLFGVVRNQSLKRLGKGATEHRGEDEPSNETSPETQILKLELAEVVARAVVSLPASLREVLLLAHYEQMTIAEIARVLGLESTTVKSRLQRARAELRDTLAVYATGMEKRR
jgi:RNA polymerase sigma-70 factor (ECF subfamily)